jgi:hypothetical protein
MKIAYTGALIATQPRKVQSGFVLTPDGIQQIASAVAKAHTDAPENTVKLTDVIGAGSGGGLATGALKMYQLGNTTSHGELVSFMLTNNVAPSHADQLSQQVLNIVNSSGAKAAFIGFSGGAATFGVLEVIKPHWSLQKKALWSVVVAVCISAIYLLLVKLGVMR